MVDFFREVFSMIRERNGMGKEGLGIDSDSKNEVRYFMAWVPTPRGFIDLREKLAGLMRQASSSSLEDVISASDIRRGTSLHGKNGARQPVASATFSKIFSNYLESDGPVEKLRNFFTRYFIDVHVSDIQTGTNGHYSEISGTILYRSQERHAEILEWVILAFWAAFIYIAFRLRYIQLFMIDHVRLFDQFRFLQSLPYLITAAALLLVPFAVFAYGFFVGGYNKRKTTSLSLLNISDFHLEYKLESNGAFLLTMNTKHGRISESDAKNIARHTYHKFCGILNLHQHLFRSPDHDNLLMPQLVKAPNAPGWHSRFIAGIFDDAEQSRVERKERDLLGSIGGLHYARVFQRVFGLAGEQRIDVTKFYADSPSISIESEQAILSAAAEYRKKCELEETQEIERLENTLQDKRNNALATAGLLFSALAILSIHQNSDVVYPQIAYITDQMLRILAEFLKFKFDFFPGILIGFLLLFIIINIYLTILTSFGSRLRLLKEGLYAFFSFLLFYFFNTRVKRLNQYQRHFPRMSRRFMLMYTDIHDVNYVNKTADNAKNWTTVFANSVATLLISFVITSYTFEFTCATLQSSLFKLILTVDSNGLPQWADRTVSAICRTESSDLVNEGYKNYLRLLSTRSRNYNGEIPKVEFSYVGNQYKIGGITADGTWNSTIIEHSRSGVEYSGVNRVIGTVDISRSSGISFPLLERVDGDLDLQGAESYGFDSLKVVSGELRAVGFLGSTLNKLDHVGGNLSLRDSHSYIFDGLKEVSGSLDVSGSSDFSFPLLEKVEGDLDLRNAESYSFGDKICVGGIIRISDESIANVFSEVFRERMAKSINGTWKMTSCPQLETEASTLVVSKTLQKDKK